MIEARIQGSPLIFVLPPASQGDKNEVFAPWLLTHSTRDLVAIHVRQADIKDHYLGLVLRRRGQRLQAVRGRANFMPHEREHHGQALNGIPVVVHNQDSSWSAVR